MQVVGVDFGTTNVRIATWDSTQPGSPQTRMLGDSYAMPAVIAFQRLRNGEVEITVGEEADATSDVPDEVVVVRNIKRWALSHDDFVRWHLNATQTPWRTWWNPDTQCIQLWGKEFPVWDLIQRILTEAFRRANIAGEFEWRTGCPANSGFDYRSNLARVLSAFGGAQRVTSVVEEPVLYLALAHRLERLDPGSYLVYDLGGGSFDCALAEVEQNRQMTVYAAHGHPLLGGSNIDDYLKDRLGYGDDRPEHLLRTAKEQLARDNPTQTVPGFGDLALGDVKAVLDEHKFIEHSIMAMREAYISARVIWKWEQDITSIGSVPSLRYQDIAPVFVRACRQNNRRVVD